MRDRVDVPVEWSVTLVAVVLRPRMPQFRGTAD